MFLESFKYKIWADERTLEVVASIDVAKFIDSYNFILQQLNHIVIVEDLFKSRIENKKPPHEATNTKVVPKFEELRFRLKESGNWYLNYVSCLNKTELQKIISFTFADGKNGAMSINEILFHIVNHGSYHRGSIAHALDSSGVAHPADGYGIFIHEVDPNRRKKT